jgi:hypothetical protein
MTAATEVADRESGGVRIDRGPADPLSLITPFAEPKDGRTGRADSESALSEVVVERRLYASPSANDCSNDRTCWVPVLGDALPSSVKRRPTAAEQDFGLVSLTSRAASRSSWRSTWTVSRRRNAPTGSARSRSSERHRR